MKLLLILPLAFLFLKESPFVEINTKDYREGMSKAFEISSNSWFSMNDQAFVAIMTPEQYNILTNFITSRNNTTGYMRLGRANMICYTNKDSFILESRWKPE